MPDTDAGAIRALRSEVVDDTRTALEIRGGLLVDLIQLVGRAHRGQPKRRDPLHRRGVLRNDRWNSDLPSLIRLLHQS